VTRTAAIVIVLLVVLLVLGAVGFVKSFGPVRRDRVAQFARRQQLPITVGNGHLVIRYLATIRRWRAGGLAAGLLVSVVHSLSRGGSASASQPFSWAGSWALSSLSGD
jgi:hypothetical protein